MRGWRDSDFWFVTLFVLLLAVGGGWVGDGLGAFLSLPFSKLPHPVRVLVPVALGFLLFFAGRNWMRGHFRSRAHRIRMHFANQEA